MSGVDEAKRDMWENQVARVLNHYQLAPTSFSAGFRIAVINWLRQMFYWLGRAGRGLLSIWLSWRTKLIGELYWIGDRRFTGVMLTNKGGRTAFNRPAITEQWDKISA